MCTRGLMKRSLLRQEENYIFFICRRVEKKRSETMCHVCQRMNKISFIIKYPQKIFGKSWFSALFHSLSLSLSLSLSPSLSLSSFSSHSSFYFFSLLVQFERMSVDKYTCILNSSPRSVSPSWTHRQAQVLIPT